jgi:hypothetical protein
MTQNALFTVSPAAEAHLRELLRYVAETVPETVNQVPTLCRGKSITTWSWRGASALPEYSDEDYSIIYYRPEQVADWPRVRVAEADLAISSDTLEKMRGLHLALEETTGGDLMSGRVVGRRY